MANITLQTIESLPLVEEVNENTSLVGWDGEKTVRVPKDMVGGSELPAASPYQQLVTDGEGNWGAEERLAWKEGEKVEITWDGNTEGLESFTSGSMTFYKVSDQIVSNDAAKVAKVTLVANGAEQAIDISSMWGDLQEGTATDDYAIAMYFCVSRKGNVEIPSGVGGGVIPSAGVWFFKQNDTVYLKSLVSNAETIHPIPAEYLTNTRFVVNFTASGDTYTADATAFDVYEAVMAGKTVTASLPYGPIPLNMFLIACVAEGDQAMASFGTFNIGMNDGKFTAMQMSLLPDGSVGLITYSNGGYE